MMDVSGFRQQHAVLAQCHQHGSQVMTIGNRLGGVRGIVDADGGHAAGFADFLAVRCDHIGAGVNSVIGALGIDDD